MSEPTEAVIAETNQGRLVLRGNELVLYDTTSGDPVAIRYRSHNETKGKHSSDKFVNGAWRELGLVIYKEDERGRTDPAHANTLEIRVLAHAPTGNFNDADYSEVFAIRHDGITVRGQPIGGGQPGRVPRFYTDGGRFMINWQDDTGSPTGIVYPTDPVTGEPTGPPIGQVRIDPL